MSGGDALVMHRACFGRIREAEASTEKPGGASVSKKMEVGEGRRV